MEGSCVYLFQKDNLVVPDGYSEESVLNGVAEQLVRDCFAKVSLDYYEVSEPDKSAITPCYALKEDVPLPDGWKRHEVRSVIIAAEKDTVDARVTSIVRAAHIMQWRGTSVFCGACGAKNGDDPGETARCCPVCGRIEYPRITPAIIAAVTNEQDEILLAHNKNFPGKMFSLLAGFNEAGETLEETVRREVFEEAGIRIKDLRYIASQPWPFPASLMIGWTARRESGIIDCDGFEIEEAHWFRRDNLPALPGLGSIARYIINLWRNGAAPFK